jgi:hypothetical protein
LLNMPVITLRRLLDREFRRLRKRLRRRDVEPDLPRPHHGMVSRTDTSGYDDDWTSSQTAVLPEGPDAGAAGDETEVEESEE